MTTELRAGTRVQGKPEALTFQARYGFSSIIRAEAWVWLRVPLTHKNLTGTMSKLHTILSFQLFDSELAPPVSFLENIQSTYSLTARARALLGVLCSHVHGLLAAFLALFLSPTSVKGKKRPPETKTETIIETKFQNTLYTH